MTNTFKQLREKITPEQIRQLKKFYEPLRKVDMSKHKGQIDKTTAQLRKLNPMSLLQLSKQDIPIVSDVAKSILGKMNPKMSTEDWKDELKNQGNVRVGKTDSKGNWHSVSTSDKKEIEKLKSQGYEVVNEAVNIKALAKQFRKNEDENRHTENYLLLAKEFGSSSDVKSVEAIIKRNKSRGYTSVEDNKWMHDNLSKHFRKVRESVEEIAYDVAGVQPMTGPTGLISAIKVEESLIVGLNKSSAEYKAGKDAAKKGIKYDANPHAPGVKRLNWSTGHNDFRADKLRKAGKPNYGARGQFEELEEGTWHIAKDITKLKNAMKKPIPNGDMNWDFVAKYIGDDELWDDFQALKTGQDMVPAIKKAMKRLNIKEADLSKTQIKMVHDKADELPKQDFIKRYGKDGDAVRYATATNIVKKKLGIGEEFNEETSPEVADVLKKFVTANPLRFHGGPGLQGGKNKRDFIELQKLALSNMDKFRKKYNDMKAKRNEDNYNQKAVRDALEKAGLSKHLTDEHKIEGDETMNESYKDKFNAQMKKFGIDSLDDLKTDAEKKAFFKAVDKSHDAVNEEKINEILPALAVGAAAAATGALAYKAGGAIYKGVSKIKKNLSAYGKGTSNPANEEDTNEGGPGSGPQFDSATIKKAYGILNDPRYKGGNYSGAAKAIEKLGKGLSDHPDVKNAMKRANEEQINEVIPAVVAVGALALRAAPYIAKAGKFVVKKVIKNPIKTSALSGGSAEKPVASEMKKEKKEMKQESRKYHDTKPGSIQDSVMQMQVNEQKVVTIRVPEFSKLVETYLLKGGVIDTSSVDEDVDLDEEINALPLVEVREFITTYNKWFSTNYRAEEFIVQVEEDVSPGAGNSRRAPAKKVGTFTKLVKKVTKGITKVIEPAKNFIQGKGYAFDK